MKKNYNDIVNLSHHVSQKHIQMSIEERAAQFAPFAALTGFSEEIKEAERLTNERKAIDENLREKLDRKLQIIKNILHINPLVTFTYFVNDLKKEGGDYITVTEKVKRINNYKKVIVLENNIEIPISEIIDITGEIFKNYEY